MLRKRSVLAAKIETTVGTAISLSASDATMPVFNAIIQPDIAFIPREGQGNFSSLTGTHEALMGTATFSVELTGGASIPAWATTFLPACGMVASSLVMSPQTNPPGSGGVKTLTIAHYIDGVKRMIHGAMGNAVFRFEAGKRVMVDFTFKGVWNNPTDVAILAPTWTTVAPLRAVAGAVAIGAASPKAANITIDLGNDVQLRQDISSTGGVLAALIADRKMKGTIDPESALVATRDNHGDWLARTEAALAISLGAASNGVAFAAPKLQFTNIQDAERGGQYIDNIDFVLNRSAALGDDELTITFQ